MSAPARYHALKLALRTQDATQQTSKETGAHGARQGGTCELNTESPLDLISLEKDLHYEFGSLYARYSRDNMVSLVFNFLLFLILVPFYLFFLFERHF